jgi:beta-lactam-binding protein with PASTA domain
VRLDGVTIAGFDRGHHRPRRRRTAPCLTKKSAAQVGAALTAAGCTLGKVEQKAAKKKLRGKVVSQAVEAGVQVKPGTAVGVVVGKEPRPGVTGLARDRAARLRGGALAAAAG